MVWTQIICLIWALNPGPAGNCSGIVCIVSVLPITGDGIATLQLSQVFLKYLHLVLSSVVFEW